VHFEIRGCAYSNDASTRVFTYGNWVDIDDTDQNNKVERFVASMKKAVDSHP
jgi:hypothetical protein